MKFKNLYALYFERHTMTRNRNQQNTHYFWKAHGPRWGEIEIESTTRMEIQDWVDYLGISSPSAATRAVNMLSAMINWGIKRGYVTCPNPCEGIDRFKIKRRDRFLYPDELKRFMRVLEMEERVYQDFFWMLLLTGARKSNVKSMRWDELDLDLKLWRFTGKNGETTNLPLADEALAILDRRSRTQRGEYVFPGKIDHIREVRRPWNRIMKRARLENLRIHDLRHTLGSYLAINGHNMVTIQKALGHKDLRSTQVYVNLPDKTIREAVQGIGDLFTDYKKLA